MKIKGSWMSQILPGLFTLMLATLVLGQEANELSPGRLAVLTNQVAEVRNDLDDLEKKIVRELDALRSAVTQLQRQVGDRLSVPTPFNSLERRLEKIERDLRTIERRISQVESRVQRLESRR